MATQIDLALATITGFHYGRRNRDVISLVEEMAITKKEWLEIKKWLKIKKGIDTYLTEHEIEEINEYFKINQ